MSHINELYVVEFVLLGMYMNCVSVNSTLFYVPKLIFMLFKKKYLMINLKIKDVYNVYEC